MAIQSNFPTTKPSLLLDFADIKQLDPRITFTRTSTATYYDGVTAAKAEENLVTYSDQFDNAAWNKSSVTITANSTTAPDGTTTADTVTPTAGTNSFSIFQVVTNPVATQTQSFYVKANGYSKVMLRESNAGGNYVAFDISLGTILFDGSGGTASITSVGNSWYRISMSISYTAGATRPSVYILSPSYTTGAMGAFTADGTSGIFIWGAQFESRLTLTAYTPTTTQAITNYIPVLQTAASGIPRFDHNPTTGESLGLLIEDSKTNLLSYSSQFDTNPWAINSTTVTITPNAVIAPDGTLTGDLLKSNTLTNDFIYQTPTVATSTIVTFSFYIKNIDAASSRTMGRSANTGMELSIVWSGATLVSLTLVTGTSASFTAVGNGWYRVQATYTTNEINQNVRIYPDNTNTGKSAFVWGAQLEAGAFATSYIPTVASQVTRSADTATMTGANFSSWFNQGEGSIYAEASTFMPISGNTNRNDTFSVSDGTGNNAIFMGVNSVGNATSINLYVITSGVAQVNISRTLASSAYKTAYGYKFNDVALILDNGTTVTDTSVTLPNLTQLAIGTRSGSSANYQNGTIKKIAYYPIRLTNAQLQSLTS